MQILSQVIGLTTYQLPLLQAGGTGHCFAQCRLDFATKKIHKKMPIFLTREAKVTTTRTIPVQVDGEAVRLNPCTIEITHLNKVLKIILKSKTIAQYRKILYKYQI